MKKKTLYLGYMVLALEVLGFVSIGMYLFRESYNLGMAYIALIITAGAAQIVSLLTRKAQTDQLKEVMEMFESKKEG